MAKFGIKKIVLALAGIGLTGTAFAGLTPDSSFSTPTPIGYGWHVSAEGLWLQPTTNDLNFATVNTYNRNSSVLNTDPSHDDHRSFSDANSISVEPSYHWGYGFEVGYQLPGTMDDINVNWTHLDGSDSDSAHADVDNTHHHDGPPPAVGTYPPDPPTPPDPTDSIKQRIVLPDGTRGYDAANGSSYFKFNEVNAEFGHTTIAGNWMVRPFAGISYVDLENNLDTVGFNPEDSNDDHHPPVLAGDPPPDPPGHTTRTTDVSEDGQFHGIGPRAGVDAKYNLGYGFGITGSVAGEMLVGDSDADMVSTTNTHTGGTEDPDSASVHLYQADEERHIIVPATEAKAGLVYDWAINSATCLGIEAGYAFAGYYQAAPRTVLDYTKTHKSKDVDYHNTAFVRNENSNFVYQGPYVALTLNF